MSKKRNNINASIFKRYLCCIIQSKIQNITLMKKICLVLTVLVLMSCNKEKENDYSVVSGNINNNVAEFVMIMSNDFEQRMQIDENDTFSDTLRLKSDGFYDLYIGREMTGIYLEKGKSLNITVDADNFDETLSYSGDLGSINNFIAEKYLHNMESLNFKEIFALEENSFFEKLDKNQKELDAIMAKHEIKNSSFLNKLKDEDKYARATMIENYESAHQFFAEKPEYRASDNFYKETKEINYADTLAFRNSMTYQNLLETHYDRLANEELLLNPAERNEIILFLEKVDNALPDGYAKDKLMTNYLQYGLKPDENLEKAFSIYKNSNPNQENLAKLSTRYNTLKSLTKGNSSPNFDFENHKGGKTSLEDLKGKYVYIDVWATWCGPCLREIPSLQEIEKDYADKNISIVSISIDEEKDYDKWKNMVTENSLGGIQLMADKNWKSQFVEGYAILGIPRFILVDPNGNIVSADAPRPSDLRLRAMLDNLL